MVWTFPSPSLLHKKSAHGVQSWAKLTTSLIQTLKTLKSLKKWDYLSPSPGMINTKSYWTTTKLYFSKIHTLWQSNDWPDCTVQYIIQCRCILWSSESISFHHHMLNMQCKHKMLICIYEAVVKLHYFPGNRIILHLWVKNPNPLKAITGIYHKQQIHLFYISVCKFVSLHARLLLIVEQPLLCKSVGVCHRRLNRKVGRKISNDNNSLIPIWMLKSKTKLKWSAFPGT